MNYYIEGTVQFNVSFSVKAGSEQEALEKAEQMLSDEYHLKSNGATSDPDTEQFDLTASEDDD